MGFPWFSGHLEYLDILSGPKGVHTLQGPLYMYVNKKKLFPTFSLLFCIGEIKGLNTFILIAYCIGEENY